MDTATIFSLILATIWGIIWATFLNRTYAGRFMAARLTWLTVVIGIGVDLAIALFIVPLDAWLRVAGLITASSIAIITKSLLNSANEHRDLIESEHDKQNQNSE